MESISGLNAFNPATHIVDTPILEGDAPSYESSSASDYQEASAINPPYVPNEDEADSEDL